MINLTDFIGKKINGPTFKDVPVKQQRKLTIRNNNKLDSVLFLQKSIGFSTLLEIQHQQQRLGHLSISRIGNKASLQQRRTNENSKTAMRNTKDELQEMRQKRKQLQKRLNQTLNKQQIGDRNYKYKNQQVQHISISQSFHRQSQNSIDQQSILKQQSQSSIINQHSQSQILSDQNNKYQQQKYKFQTEKSQSSLQFQTQIKSNLNQQTDQFLIYLKRDIYFLKCQKFLAFLKNFKNKWLLKNLNQSILFRKIIERQQKDLTRFMFISWKRYYNQQKKKLEMAELIRRRIQKNKQLKQQSHKNVKLSMQYNLKAQVQNHKNVKDMNDQHLQFKKKQCLIGDIAKSVLKSEKQAERHLTPQKQDRVRQNMEDISRVSLRSISSIRQKTNRFQLQLSDHELSCYYDQYSCITEKQEESQTHHPYQHQEEQFIK